MPTAPFPTAPTAPFVLSMKLTFNSQHIIQNNNKFSVGNIHKFSYTCEKQKQIEYKSHDTRNYVIFQFA